MQAIYYPGFTIVGLVGELGALIVLAVLLYLMPYETSRFIGVLRRDPGGLPQ